MQRSKSVSKLTIISSIIALTLISCGKSAPSGPPPPTVTVAKPLRQDVTSFDEYSGHLESPQTVNLSARVSGIVMQAPFTEGALVKAGQTIFVIDDRPFKADVASKEADVARAHAQSGVAGAQLKRFESVKGTKAISAQDYDQAVASSQQAVAQVSGAEAALNVSRLNLEWTHVSAPIDGKIGKKLVTEGNLVNGGAGQATPLTSITSIDPIYAYVNVPEIVFLKYQTFAKNAAPSADAVNGYDLPCSVQLENEKTYQHHGKINFVDNHVDPATGTVEMRCVVSNGDAALTPGLFAKVQIEGEKSHSALLVPDLAINSDQNTKLVLTVDQDGTVKPKQVTLGGRFGLLRAIADGLTGDEQVIVNGLQYARPNAKVTANQITLNPDGSLPAPPPAAAGTPNAPEKK